MCGGGGGGGQAPAPTVDPEAERQEAADKARQASNAKLAANYKTRQAQTVLASGAGNAATGAGGTTAGNLATGSSILAAGKDKLGAF